MPKQRYATPETVSLTQPAVEDQVSSPPMVENPAPNRSSRPSTRVSLACAPCRSKHIRCDATTPVCSRCRAEGLQCVYLKSRRGGRRRPGSSQTTTANTPLLQHSLPLDIEEARSTSTEDEHSHSPPERFYSQYYSFFHAAHPCVLPQWALKRRLAEDGRLLQTLTIVMQYIGSIFAKSERSASLKADAEQAITPLAAHDAITGFDVQAVLLFSIAVYWGGEAQKALNLLDKAISMALNLGMNRQDFASANGNNDPLLEECWRRTWWQIYVTDAHIAGSTHTFPFRTSKVEMNVDLPCDEEGYEAGNIPRPRTLQEYDMREFMGDDGRTFSSFAEFIGLTRSLDLALSSRRSMDMANAPAICANIDASVTAWRSLLPSKKDIVRGDGSFDEILFKANMIIHTYTVDLHRQLSTLAYSPVEAIAHCAPLAPPESLRGCNTAECQLHTAKVLRAIEQLEDLLTLPTDIATHTPFIICMIANIVIAHLAACRYFYQGQQLKLARERIRLSMGVLKVLSEYWPMGQRTYKEVGIIAREILGLKDQTKDKQAQKQNVEVVTQEVTPLGAGVSELSAFLDEQSLIADIQLLDTNFDFCGLFDINVACS